MLHRYTNAKTMLIVVVLSMMLFIGSLFCQFLKLHYADPLDNIQVRVESPVHITDEEIVWIGIYDRDVKCTLIAFKVFLTSVRNDDIIVLDQRHLTRTPKPNTGPGNAIPISFALAMPKTVYPGMWKSVFYGNYVCQNGIFMERKHVELPVTGIRILPEDIPE